MALASQRRSFSAFAVLGAAVLATVFFTVVKSGLGLPTTLQIYPYAAAAALGLYAAFKPGRQTGIREPRAVVVLIWLAALPFLYHLLVLEEPLEDLLYTFRFYFGMFGLFLGFALFLFSIDAGAAATRRWIKRTTAAVLVSSFLLAAAEYIGVIAGLALPKRFWWIRQIDLADITRYQAEHIHSAIRAYGIASNPPVLGAFSVFLTVYYLSLIEPAPSPAEALVAACGLATVFLSMSGTGLALLIAVSAVLLCRNWRRMTRRARSLRIASFLVIGFLAVLSQWNESGRFSAIYASQFEDLFSRTFSVVLDCMNKEPLDPFFGPVNLYSAYKSGVAPWDLAGGSFYDFTALGFAMDMGLVGIAVYLVSLLGLIVSAIPKGNFTARLSVLALLAGSIHYPSIFWMCSQGMLAAILSTELYIRRRSAA